jgi:hypothetical protein
MTATKIACDASGPTAGKNAPAYQAGFYDLSYEPSSEPMRLQWHKKSPSNIRR